MNFCTLSSNKTAYAMLDPSGNHGPKRAAVIPASGGQLNTISNESPVMLAEGRTSSFGTQCCGSLIGESSSDGKKDGLSGTSELKETEDFLAAEMNKLSFQERNKALEDVHCVGQELNEDPGLVALQLQAFQKEVDVLRPKTRVYQSAEKINAEYVTNRSFRLRFLRANRYDVKKAVNQMMKFLHCKEVYFGKERLCKEIDLSDLTEEDREYMRKGAFHVPKQRDRSGRPIVQIQNTKLGLGSAVNVVSTSQSSFGADDCPLTNTFAFLLLSIQIRVSYYIFWNLLIPLEEAQLKGVSVNKCCHARVEKVEVSM